MVGLHGVGGLGKTTVCKMMCNFYTSEYPGKSCLIEFPTDGSDHKIVHDHKIVQECKKALKQLANLSDEHVLNRADSFDQVVQLMKDNFGRYDVFLAIDNVWESSLDEAKRILGVSFTSNTKILLTSRSEAVLKDLVGDSCSACVRPLPSPAKDEALQIFQQTFEDGDLKSLVNRDLLDRVLYTCFFSGKYHALALNALGKHVKRAGKLNKIEDILSEILQGIVPHNVDVEGLLRLNYVNLAPVKQHMFLDIVVVVMDYALKKRVALTTELAHQWLSMLYKDFSKSTISKLIYELALDGLIQIDDKNAGKLVGVHDLYSDLAQKEAAKSARFFTNRSPKKIEWENLERVILSKSNLSSHFYEELQYQQQCPNLAVLCVRGIYVTRGTIHLDLMPSLCVLDLDWGIVGSINASAATGLAIVHLKHLRCLINLHGLSRLTCLERLVLENNRSMEEVVGGLSPALKQVEVRNCWALKRMPDLRGLTCLERLVLKGNESMEEVVGGLSPALKDVQVKSCCALKRMPDLSGLTCLETLVLKWNEAMEEVGGENLSSTLKVLRIDYCIKLWCFPSLNECVHLHTLEGNGDLIDRLDRERRECKALEEIGDLNALHSLESKWHHVSASTSRSGNLKWQYFT